MRFRCLLVLIVGVAAACGRYSELDSFSAGAPDTGATDAGASDVDDGAAAAEIDSGSGDADPDAAPPCVPVTKKKSPTLLASGGGPGPEWSDPGGASVEDGLQASVGLTSSGTGNSTSEALVAGGFGFAIPDGAVIRGLTVHLRRRAPKPSNEDVRDAELRLGPNSVPSGEDRAAHPWPANFVTVEYGGPEDLWGLSLTPAMLNAEAFSIIVRARNHGSAGDAHVDAIAVSVTYCE